MLTLKSAPLRGLLLLLTLPLLFAACATKPQIKGLTARVIALAPVPGETDTYLLTMEYYNDNVSPIGLSRSQHRLHLAGVSLGRIDSDIPLALPPLSSARQEMVLRVDQPELRARLAGLSADDQITYRLTSTLIITVGSEDLRSASDSEGRVGLTR